MCVLYGVLSRLVVGDLPGCFLPGGEPQRKPSACTAVSAASSTTCALGSLYCCRPGPTAKGVTETVENCVTWVFTALVTVLGQAWTDFDVYMPQCWAEDPDRRRKACIPKDLAFATKPELAINQVKRLMAAGARALWAAADEVYGRCGEFRGTLRALSLAYVVIIPCDSGSPSPRTKSSALTRQ
jgi:DDE superfamily endonuclease